MTATTATTKGENNITDQIVIKNNNYPDIIDNNVKDKVLVAVKKTGQSGETISST